MSPRKRQRHPRRIRNHTRKRTIIRLKLRQSHTRGIINQRRSRRRHMKRTRKRPIRTPRMSQSHHIKDKNQIMSWNRKSQSPIIIRSRK